MAPSRADAVVELLDHLALGVQQPGRLVVPLTPVAPGDGRGPPEQAEAAAAVAGDRSRRRSAFHLVPHGVGRQPAAAPLLAGHAPLQLGLGEGGDAELAVAAVVAVAKDTQFLAR